MYQIFRAALVILAIAIQPPVALAGTADTAVLTVQQAVAQALEGNPNLAQMKARAEAAAAIPDQAGALPDPTISFNALNLPVDTFDIAQEPMTQMQFGISQALPFPGKLALKEQAARHEAEAAAKSVEETRLTLIRDVKATWWRIFYLDRAIEIVRRNQDLLREFVQIAQTKYKVGEGLQQDVLLAQVELSQLLDREIQLKAARRTQVARLAALMDRPVEQDVQLPAKVEIDLPPPPDETTLHGIADESRPLLARLERELAAADSRVELAKKDLMPDFGVGAAYGIRSGSNADGSNRPDFLSLRLNMSVPLYAARKQQRAVDQRTSERLGRRFALEDARNQVRQSIATILAEYRQAREQARLYERAIIPQARQTVASMLSGYQVNKVDFLNLVRAQITLYNHETRYWQAISEARQALARLAAAVGKEIQP